MAISEGSAVRWRRLREGRGQASPGVGLARQSEALTVDEADRFGFRSAGPSSCRRTDQQTLGGGPAAVGGSPPRRRRRPGRLAAGRLTAPRRAERGALIQNRRNRQWSHSARVLRRLKSDTCQGLEP